MCFSGTYSMLYCTDYQGFNVGHLIFKLWYKSSFPWDQNCFECDKKLLFFFFLSSKWFNHKAHDKLTEHKL